MIERGDPLGPVEVEVRVATAPDRAFTLWTDAVDTWWPPSHSVSGEDDLQVVFETGVGGRIFERTSAGVEHDWGQVVAWDPPRRVAYQWHLRFPAEEATDVEVTFTPDGDDTLVRIVQRGWERLGPKGPPRRERNVAGWAGVTPRFVAAADGP